MLTVKEKLENLDFRKGDKIELYPDTLLNKIGELMSDGSLAAALYLKRESKGEPLKVNGLRSDRILDLVIHNRLYQVYLDYVLGHYFEWGQDVLFSDTGQSWQTKTFIGYTPGWGAEYRASLKSKNASHYIIAGYRYAKPVRKPETFPCDLSMEINGMTRGKLADLTEQQFQAVADLIDKYYKENEVNDE